MADDEVGVAVAPEAAPEAVPAVSPGIAGGEIQAAQLLNPALTILEGLKQLWFEEKFTDMTLICQGGETVRVHKLTLALLSPFFRTIIATSPRTEEDLIVSIPEVTASVLRNALQHVYVGNDEEARLDLELAHLDFGCKPYEPVVIPPDEYDIVRGGEWKRSAFVKAEFMEYSNDSFAYDNGVTDMDADDNYDEDPDYEGPNRWKRRKAGKSRVWRYFDKIDKHAAKCKACDCEVKTQNGNTTGMMRHIARFHPEIADKLGEAGFTDDGEMAQGLKRSKVWSFFEAIDQDLAKCYACGLEVKTQRGNTSGMSRHLFRTHLDLYNNMKEEEMAEFNGVWGSSGVNVKVEQTDESYGPSFGSTNFFDNNEDQDYKVSIKTEAGTGGGGGGGNRGGKGRGKRKRSLIWKYYMQDSTGVEAKCRYCDILVKTEQGNTSGLVSHLRAAHPEQYDELNILKGIIVLISFLFTMNTFFYASPTKRSSVYAT